MAFARTWFLRQQFNFDRVIQITRVSFVRIDVYFQLARFVRPHEQVFQNDGAARRFNAEIHAIAVGYAVALCVAETHVDVTFGANDAFLQLDNTGGTYQDATRSAGDVAALADRRVDAEADGVGKGEFDLAVITRRAKDANVGEHAATRSDDHYRLLCCVEAVLVKVLHRRKRLPRTEEGFDMLISKMAMSGRDADDKL